MEVVYDLRFAPYTVTEIYDRNTITCNTAKYGRKRPYFPRIRSYTIVYGVRNVRPGQQDLADAIELIKILNLNRSFADLLHPAVRNKFEQLILGLEEDRQKGSVDDE